MQSTLQNYFLVNKYLLLFILLFIHELFDFIVGRRFTLL